MPWYLINLCLKDWIQVFLFVIFCIVCWNVANNAYFPLHLVYKCLSLTGFCSMRDLYSPFFLIKATPAWNYGQYDQNIQLSFLFVFCNNLCLSNYINWFLRCILNFFSFHLCLVVFMRWSSWPCAQPEELGGWCLYGRYSLTCPAWLDRSGAETRDSIVLCAIDTSYATTTRN